MVKFRDLNYEEDIDDVVKLININLDPDYTRDLFLWKHYYNPFGRSISMVATEQEKIVAVVFYMKYNFQNKKGEIIRTIRPLDVCTDKEQRGKGLFKILLTECLKQNRDYDILFSTPNPQSYPEFIKLGWLPLENYKFRVGVINGLFKVNSIKVEESDCLISGNENLNTLDFFRTATSPNFLNWRFNDKNYSIRKIIKGKKEGFLIYRIDRIKNIKCLILCDFIGDENLINPGLRGVCKKEKLSLVYYLNNALNSKIRFMFSVPLRRAIIIYKENMHTLPDNILISLADLEGRL